MRSLRQKAIATCMDDLAAIRSTFGKNHPQSVSIQVWECDQLEELHRLIWEEMELSAAGPNLERSTSVLPGSDARNDDGRLAALNCVSGEAAR